MYLWNAKGSSFGEDFGRERDSPHACHSPTTSPEGACRPEALRPSECACGSWELLLAYFRNEALSSDTRPRNHFGVDSRFQKLLANLTLLTTIVGRIGAQFKPNDLGLFALPPEVSCLMRGIDFPNGCTRCRNDVAAAGSLCFHAMLARGFILPTPRRVLCLNQQSLTEYPPRSIETILRVRFKVIKGVRTLPDLDTPELVNLSRTLSARLASWKQWECLVNALRSILFRLALCKSRAMANQPGRAMQRPWHGPCNRHAGRLHTASGNPFCAPGIVRRARSFRFLEPFKQPKNKKPRRRGPYHLYSPLGHFSPKMLIFIGEGTQQNN